MDATHLAHSQRREWSDANVSVGFLYKSASELAARGRRHRIPIDAAASHWTWELPPALAPTGPAETRQSRADQGHRTGLRRGNRRIGIYELVYHLTRIREHRGRVPGRTHKGKRTLIGRSGQHRGDFKSGEAARRRSAAV